MPVAFLNTTAKVVKYVPAIRVDKCPNFPSNSITLDNIFLDYDSQISGHVSILLSTQINFNETIQT
jgi:hypothetical protein